MIIGIEPLLSTIWITARGLRVSIMEALKMLNNRGPVGEAWSSQPEVPGSNLRPLLTPLHPHSSYQFTLDLKLNAK